MLAPLVATLRRARLDGRGGPVEVLDIQDGNLRGTVVPTASSRVPDPDEARVFLDLAERVLDRLRPQVLLTYGGHPAVLELMASARRRGVAVVFFLRNLGYTQRRTFANVHRVLVPSQYVASHYAQRLGLSCTVLPSPIRFDRVVADAPEPRYLTFVNPQPAKGVTVFARIAAELSRRPDIPMLVVEGRGTVEDLTRVGLDLSVTNNFHWMASTTDPRDFYRVSRAVLVPSLCAEASSRVAAESLANGLPVLASDRGGLPETLGDAGFVFPLPMRCTPKSGVIPTVGEVAPWLEAIERLWDDPYWEDEQRRRAFKAALRWEERRLVPQYEAVLRNAASVAGRTVTGIPNDAGPDWLDLADVREVAFPTLTSNTDDAVADRPGPSPRGRILHYRPPPPCQVPGRSPDLSTSQNRPSPNSYPDVEASQDDEARLTCDGQETGRSGPDERIFRVAELMDRGRERLRHGDLAETERSLRKILDVEPDHSEAMLMLGGLLRALGRLEEAEAIYDRLLRLHPEFAEARLQLGNLRYRQSRLEEAEAAYRAARQMRPDHAETSNNLGAALADQGRLEEAEACYREAIRLRPDYADAHYNLGNSLRRRGRLEEAEACYREAIRLRPDQADLLNNLGIALADQGRLEEAEACYREAIRLRPDQAEVINNLGATLADQGRLEEAEVCYREAARLQPDYADPQHNRSLILLLKGCFGPGWAAYEWRWRRAGFCPPRFSQPTWDGSPLRGRTILLYTEQGAGDILQFIRYVGPIRRSGGRVVLAGPPNLLPFLACGPAVDELVSLESSTPAFDVHASLMSLPRILGTTLETVPAEIPYLFPTPELVDHWRQKLEPVRGYRIGIAWSGNPTNPYNRRRSIPPRWFAELARLEGVRLISLQKQDRGGEPPGADFPVIDWTAEMDRAGAFLDTAAVMLNLDLVVACDSSLAHLAGALGVPVWLPLPAVPDWRWMLDRDDSPWYPTMRLFRQSRPGCWEEPFHRMLDALRGRFGSKTSRLKLTLEIAPGELIDKITILQIKRSRIEEPEKLDHIQHELAGLIALRDRALGRLKWLATTAAELSAVNEAIWDAEERLRACELAKDFGPQFIVLARSIYHNNDRRASIKKWINYKFDSAILEEKSYPLPDLAESLEPTERSGL